MRANLSINVFISVHCALTITRYLKLPAIHLTPCIIEKLNVCVLKRLLIWPQLMAVAS
jgi:hypothetical protein